MYAVPAGCVDAVGAEVFGFVAGDRARALSRNAAKRGAPVHLQATSRFHVGTAAIAGARMARIVRGASHVRRDNPAKPQRAQRGPQSRQLVGIVIHCGDAPGGDALRAIVRRVRFMLDHHRQIERIALAADGPLASLIAQIAQHFANAEIKRFRLDELDAATPWASTARDQKPRSDSAVGQTQYPGRPR